MAEADDEQVDIEQSQAGDREAFGRLVRAYQDRLYRFIRHMVGSHDEALELTQDALIKAWQALPQWQPQAQFRTWLYRIAANTATDALRRRKAVAFVALEDDHELPDEAAGPEARLDAKRQVQAMDRALARLPDDQRQALLLKEVDDMSYEEIGAVLGISLGTVKSRISRAREALARQRESQT